MRGEGVCQFKDKYRKELRVQIQSNLFELILDTMTNWL